MVPFHLVGEGQGEGWRQSTEGQAPPNCKTANGWGAGLIGSWIRTKSSAAVPLSLSLPHKGGGNVVALLCPSPRNTPACGTEMCACLSAQAGTQGDKRSAEHVAPGSPLARGRTEFPIATVGGTAYAFLSFLRRPTDLCGGDL